MRLLLDTHAVLWWLAEPDRLSNAARSAIERPDTSIFLSSVVTAEIAIKHAIGRLKLPATPAELITALLREHGFEPLALEHAHSLELGRLPLHHRDPFDRMLVAQCRIERLHLVSCDRSMGLYDVDILW